MEDEISIKSNTLLFHPVNMPFSWAFKKNVLISHKHLKYISRVLNIKGVGSFLGKNTDLCTHGYQGQMYSFEVGLNCMGWGWMFSLDIESQL